MYGEVQRPPSLPDDCSRMNVLSSIDDDRVPSKW